MTKKRTHKCEVCEERTIPINEQVCSECGDSIEHEALADMYGEDADYLYWADIMPGDK